jgi:hypothetical protein
MNTQRPIHSRWRPALAALAVTLLTAAAQPANYSAFKIITDRNIFNPNRQPHSRFNTVRSGGAQPVTESISLVGTMSYEKGDYAFFDGTSSEFRKAVKPGGRIAGFAVTAVGTNYVKMLQGSNELQVVIGTKLRRDDEGNWAIPDSAYVAGRSRRNAGWQRDYGTNRPPVDLAAGTDTNAPATNDLAGAGQDVSQPEVIVITDTSAEAYPSSDPMQTPADTAAPPAGNPSGPAGGATDPLTRLMQLRAQEEQQLQR